MFSEEALVGVKCRWKRGCLESHALTLSVVWGRVGVEHRAHLARLRHMPVDAARELQGLKCPVARLAFAEHPARCHAEHREQRGRAVALVARRASRHAGGVDSARRGQAALLQRQTRLGPVEGLYLGRLVMLEACLRHDARQERRKRSLGPTFRAVSASARRSLSQDRECVSQCALRMRFSVSGAQGARVLSLTAGSSRGAGRRCGSGDGRSRWPRGWP